MGNEFDAIANTYDADFTNSVIGKLQRDIVWKYLDKGNIVGKSVLEINCGTGEDAVFLAQKGNRITVTDVSAQMLQVAQHKFTKNNIAIDAFIWDLNHSFPFPEKKYDVVFSNFGGINCLSPQAVKKLSAEFNTLLNPGGRLIFVVLGRFCLWETVYFLLKGKFTSAFRRSSRSPVKAKLSDDVFVDTWYYSVKEIKKSFSRGFKYINKKPVGVLVPPGYMENYFGKKKWLLNIFVSFDNLYQKLNFLSLISDHFLIEFKKA